MAISLGVLSSARSGNLATGFTSIATVTPSAVSTITFSSIPATYKSLHLRFNLVTTSATNLQLRFNSDTSTANYAMHYLSLAGSLTAGGVASGTNGFIKLFNNASVTTNPSSGIIDVIDYASTSKNKTARAVVGGYQTTTGVIELDSGVWLSTSAINSVTILSAAGTFTGSITLYGVN